MIVLDTSFLIDLFKGERKTLSIVDSDVATTVITYHEILSGIKHKKSKKEEMFSEDFSQRSRFLNLI